MFKTICEDIDIIERELLKYNYSHSDNVFVVYESFTSPSKFIVQFFSMSEFNIDYDKYSPIKGYSSSRCFFTYEEALDYCLFGLDERISEKIHSKVLTVKLKVLHLLGGRLLTQ